MYNESVISPGAYAYSLTSLIGIVNVSIYNAHNGDDGNRGF